ncbi:MAG: hydrogen gas-evolving membrane-bound hydrogenase subunit E [Clostridium sp.]
MNNFFIRLLDWVNGELPIDKDTTQLEKESPYLYHEDYITPHEESLKMRVMDWSEKNGTRVFANFYKIFSVIICSLIIMVLLITVSCLPEFSKPDNPASNEVAARYIEKGMEETGAINIVTGMILDYRAFDTFGEAAVLFLAAIGVIMLLYDTEKGSCEKKIDERESYNAILQSMAGLIIPFIILFGIYIILNGHLSPGGGFSGGAIIGAAFILYANAFGFEKIHSFFSFKIFTAISCGSLIVYAIAKGYSFFTGANHLSSIIKVGTPGNILSGGFILLLNVCVGLTVTVTMYGFYSLFREGDI